MSGVSVSMTKKEVQELIDATHILAQAVLTPKVQTDMYMRIRIAELHLEISNLEAAHEMCMKAVAEVKKEDLPPNYFASDSDLENQGEQYAE